MSERSLGRAYVYMAYGTPATLRRVTGTRSRLRLKGRYFPMAEVIVIDSMMGAFGS